MDSIYLNSPYPQPVDGGEGPRSDGIHEYVDCLPNTNLRIWYSAKQEFYPTHWHSEMEIIYCCCGYYTAVVNENTFTIMEGDVLLIPGSVTHSLDLSKDCHGFVYFLSLDLLEHIPSASIVKPLITYPILYKKNKSLLYQTVTGLLDQMKNEYFSKNDLRELMVYSHVLRLFTEIARIHLTGSKEQSHLRPDKQKEYIERFSDVLNFINANYTEDITLSNISRQFGFSKYHFSRLFSQYTTYTFIDYLTYVRIRGSEKLLLESDLNITDLSTQVGFNSLSAFSRAFKQKNHCAPSEFRQLYSKN